MRGYIHVYTGKGKGKTTAALGLAIRAAGAGKKVWVAQFVKGMPYSELQLIKERIPEIKIHQFGLDCFIQKIPSEKDIQAAGKGLKEFEKTLLSDKYDMIILDEVFIALYYKLFTSADLLKILNQKPERTEIIMTGRYAPRELIETADLVTEMKEIKHYYNDGIEAREGIEF